MRELFLKLTNKKYSKIALIVVSIFFIALVFLVIFTKYFLSYSFIEKQFYKLTNLKIEFIEPQSNFNIRFNINTKAKALNIYNENKTTQFASIINPKITFKPFGLLFNRAYIKNLSADDIKIKIKQDKQGKIDILNSLSPDFNKLFEKQKLTITRLDGNFKKINLLYDSDLSTKNQIKLNLIDVDFKLSKKDKIFILKQKGNIETNISNKKQTASLNIDIKSKYPFKNFNSDDLKLDVKLNDINLFAFSNLAKKYISKDIESTDGFLNLEVVTDENKIQKLTLKTINPTLKLNNKQIIAPYKEGLTLTSDFKIDKNNIEIINLKTTAKDLNASLNGKIENLNKKPTLAFDIDINNTQINNLIPFIPDNAIFYRPKGIPTLKKANFYGVANGKINLNLFPLNIGGNLKISNVHIPNYPKPYKQNDVNLIFMKDKMRILTRVYTPQNEYVAVDGISNLDKSLYGKYSVKSTSKIDLAFAQKYLVPIQQIIGFNIGPVPIMNMSGYGNIDINTQGTIYDAQIFGIFRAFNASAKINGLDAKLENGSCELIFKDRDLIFEKIKGNLDKSNFLLTGRGNTKGEVKLDVKISDAKTNNLLKTFKNSQITKSYSFLANEINSISGTSNLSINLLGTIEDYEKVEFLNSLSLSGDLSLKENDLIFNNRTKINKITGFINFGQSQKGKIDFNINNSRFATEFSSNDNITKISKGESINITSQISSNKINFNDFISFIQNDKTLNKNIKNLAINFEEANFYSKLLLKSQGKITLKGFSLDNLKHDGYIIGLNSAQTPNVKFNSGLIKINGSKLTFDNFNADILKGKVKINGNIDNFSSKRPVGNLAIFLNDIALEKLDKISSNIKTKNGIIKKGVILFKNDDIKLHSLSLDYANTPIFISANLKDIYSNKIIDANFSTLINENSADNIINPYLVSPFKIIGELPIKGSLKGNNDNYTIDFSAVIPKDSDFSYSGANLGDSTHKREIEGKINVVDNIANIHNLKLIKYITNQNNKTNPIVILKANGKIAQKNEALFYDNLKISSTTPINVRILNLIFKKSLLKKGNFDCDITLNDNVKLPKINGKINLYDLGIPLYDTQIHNIKVDISDNFIDSEILASNKESDARLKLHMLNKLTTPYVVKDFILSSNNLNVNNILSSIQPTSTKTDILPKTEFNIKQGDVIVEKGSFDFKDVQYNQINAQNLKGNLSYKNSIFNLEKISLNLAQGLIEAKGTYDLKTTKLNLSANMKDCDSNILSKDFLLLSDQIFGKMNGSIALSAKNLNTPQGIRNIKSDINFSINNGKMPKLGSLEYLLRAGNVLKNGIMGLSLNNIIEVLTPYKTGEFEKISGKLSINNAEIENLNIATQGKNLSLFLDGNYSILENFADIEIYGKLSQNVSNALGALGNASINQFVDSLTQNKKNKNEKYAKIQEKLDKIPPIEIDNNKPRFFQAKVLGDINKDNYIKNFNWL